MPASLGERAARVLIVGLPEMTRTDDPLLDELAEIGVGGVLLTHKNVRTADQVRAGGDPHAVSCLPATMPVLR